MLDGLVSSFLENLWSLQTLRQLIDVSIVAYLIYRTLLIIRGTRAAPMLVGLTIIVLLYFLAKPLGLSTLSWILGNFLSSILLVVVVIFQDEIRRGLTKFGLTPIFSKTPLRIFDKTIEDIVHVAANLSDQHMGGLIVIQQEVGLDDFVEDAVILDAALNRKLLYGLFVKDSPLHDGAVLIDGNRIRAAGCVLPLSYDPDLDPNLGTRHRAAYGISEISDAIAIVISEGTGSISVAQDGKMIRNLEAPELKEYLHRTLSSKKRLIEDEEGGE